MNILYIHGLDSHPKEDKNKIMEKYSDRVIAPKLDHRGGPLFGKLSSIIKKEKIDLIIGSSMGGYLGYHLSNLFKLPSLLFNPALHSERADEFQPVPKIVKEEQYKDKMVILGKDDDIIDPKITIPMIKGKVSKIYLVPGLGHRIPLFEFEKYFDEFYDSIT